MVRIRKWANSNICSSWEFNLIPQDLDIILYLLNVADAWKDAPSYYPWHPNHGVVLQIIYSTKKIAIMSLKYFLNIEFLCIVWSIVKWTEIHKVFLPYCLFVFNWFANSVTHSGLNDNLPILEGLFISHSNRIKNSWKFQNESKYGAKSTSGVTLHV